ncbi:hypothetical protein EJB05_48135, partial [Eragrostis curvula]
MLDSGFAEFKLDYMQIKHFAIGSKQISEPISVGGYLWRMFCYPRGDSKEVSKKGEYMSSSREQARQERVPDGQGRRAILVRRTKVRAPSPASVPYTVWGWPQFVKSSDHLDPLHVRNGVVNITWGVIVARRAGRDS